MIQSISTITYIYIYTYAPVSGGTTPKVCFWNSTFVSTHLVPGTLPDSLRAGVALLGSSKVGKKVNPRCQPNKFLWQIFWISDF